MLSQVGSVTTNGIQQKSDYRDSTFTAFADMPVWPNLLSPSLCSAGIVPAVHRHPRLRSRLRNPRITSLNIGFEREVASRLAAYADFTYAKGANLTRFLNYNVHGTGRRGHPAGDPRT